MNKRDIKVLRKLLEHAERAVKYAKTCDSYEAFISSDMIIDASVFNIMQIGELAKAGLSEEARNELSTIPWKSIFGMRNRIVHGYDSVDMKVVWETITESMPIFINELKQLDLPDSD